MKKIPIAALVISLLANFFLVYFFFIKGETHALKNDSRIAIVVSKDNKEFVMAEMRGFLESIRDINVGISTNDTAKIIKAAAKGGGAATEHVPNGLLKALPMEFKKLGFDTHDKFDQLAAAVAKKYDKEETQKKLSAILGNCTSCHQSYKFETKP